MASSRPPRPGPRASPRSNRSAQRGGRPAAGLHYDPRFVSARDRAEVLQWLSGIHPIWEERYASRKLADSVQQRRLLRPVYWLGNWQFACLDYYRPPHGVKDRCVRAEPFPPPLARWVARAESIARKMYRGPDLPAAWKLNTCLVNLYGSRIEGGKRIDTARVGEHRDFEPGPVASVSLGERALFQFVGPSRPHQPARIVAQQWLDDGSLQIFGGDQWKNRTFHRVLRVDKRGGHRFPPEVGGFETRRVNFTFRYVPEEHVIPFAALSSEARGDVRRYVQELARHSPFFAGELAKESSAL